MAIADVLEVARRDPSAVAVFTDFDGTLSHIHADPDAVVPVDGAVVALEALRQVLGAVAVISGRPIDFLARHIPEAVDLSGLYGIERRVGGVPGVIPEADAWRPVIREQLDDAQRRFPPEVIEDKGYSLTLHFRRTAELEDEVALWAHEVAAQTGLQARPAKMSIELHPPLPLTKGDAVRSLTSGQTAIVYLGDDHGDAPAWQELRAGAYEAIACVVVTSDDTPEELRGLATDIVSSPESAVALLNEIASVATGQVSSSPSN